MKKQINTVQDESDTHRIKSSIKTRCRLCSMQKHQKILYTFDPQGMVQVL